ncbi:MAG: V-type ATP synthase subunit D [Lachnospiraceae bacterium]|nr:V-type ATP synthase subunit D [Lachnospiraceae bacterium]
MNLNAFPTKGNLIIAKNSLALATQGYELMDKKRNILIKELMDLIDKASSLQGEIDEAFSAAYAALQNANVEMGISHVMDIAQAVPVTDDITIKVRSVMGTEIPLVEHTPAPVAPTYSYYKTTESLDIAREKFETVKELTIRLSTVETSAFRLATNIKKTQKRANALKNITIPAYTKLVKDMSAALEEKEREEFTRLKVIKHFKSTEE